MTRGFLLCGAGILLAVALGGFSFAHDANINADLVSMSPVEFEHQDADPFKGWVNVAVRNSSNVPWGDFHFQIVPCMGSDVSSVDIVDVDPFKPTTDRSPFSYVVDNAVVGSTLDYYFYGDSVANGETASFTFYTDNTASHVNFCLMMCPTPVPEPATLGLLILGLGSLALMRRRG